MKIGERDKKVLMVGAGAAVVILLVGCIVMPLVRKWSAMGDELGPKLEYVAMLKDRVEGHDSLLSRRDGLVRKLGSLTGEEASKGEEDGKDKKDNKDAGQAKDGEKTKDAEGAKDAKDAVDGEKGTSAESSEKDESGGEASKADENAETKESEGQKEEKEGESGEKASDEGGKDTAEKKDESGEKAEPGDKEESAKKGQEAVDKAEQSAQKAEQSQEKGEQTPEHVFLAAYVERVSQQAGMKFKRVSPKRIATGGKSAKSFTAAAVQFSVEGNIRNLVKMLHALEKGDRFVRVEQLQLQRNVDQGGTVEASLDVIAYEAKTR